MRFEGRTAVITGGAIGFGRAFARALVAEGAGVVIADIDVDMAERTAASLVDAGGRAIAVGCDVADVGTTVAIELWPVIQGQKDIWAGWKDSPLSNHGAAHVPRGKSTTN